MSEDRTNNFKPPDDAPDDATGATGANAANGANGRSAGDASAESGALPNELRGVGRLLDERGARARGQLRADALERILAASEFQRPLSLDEVRPVAGRIGLARTSRVSPSRVSSLRVSPSRAPLLRLAAAIAALVGLGAVIVVAVSVERGATEPSNTLVEATKDGASHGEDRSTAAPTAIANVSGQVLAAPQGLAAAPQGLAAARQGAFEHFDAVLEGNDHELNAQRPGERAIAALAEGGAGAIARVGFVLAGFVGGDDVFASDVSTLFASSGELQGARMSYGDLSDELAALAMGAAGSGAR
jgi:hypothetical protein